MADKNDKDLNLEDEFSRESKDTPLECFLHCLVRFFGSWFFLLLNLIWFSVWVIFGLHYDWLTFWVSLEAIVLSVLILINENRELQSDRRRAIKDYKIDLSTAKKLKGIEKEIEELKGMLQTLLDRGGSNS